MAQEQAVHPSRVMPAPNLLDCELAEGGWVSGVFQQTRQLLQIQSGKESSTSSLRAQGVWTGQCQEPAD